MTLLYVHAELAVCALRLAAYRASRRELFDLSERINRKIDQLEAHIIKERQRLGCS